jgi:hypothetical protein
MTIYNPFHSIGLYSVFETDAIRSADVHSGGFGVEYGDRTSAIVSVTTKDGNKKRQSGKLALNPILAKVFLEEPGSEANPKTLQDFQLIIWEELFVFIIDDNSYEKIDKQKYMPTYEIQS